MRYNLAMEMGTITSDVKPAPGPRTSGIHAEPPVTTLDWDNDPENPRTWPLPRKAGATLIVSGIGFVSTFASSIYSPGHDDVVRAFGGSTTVALLPLSFYNLGMAFGPIISSPLSETFGRKAVYLSTIPCFALFTLGAGFSQSVASLIVCRFFAGVFAAPGVSIASATITDVVPQIDRAVPFACYYTVPFIGSLLGVLVGGYVVEGKGWRWTQWTILFFNVVCLVSLLFVRETYKKIILERRARKTVAAGSLLPKGNFWNEARYFATKTVVRPLHMLFTEPIVALVCLYCGFQFALLYTFVVASPYIFSTVYGFDLGSQGLSFLGFITGSLFAPPILLTLDRYLYQPRLAAFKKQMAESSQTIPFEFPPEHRLYSAMLGSVILPIALFTFAWITRSSVHWICPIIAQAFSILGSILIYVGANFYMVDTYGPLYSASAAGATSLTRYSLAAAFPLFTLQMYKALGVGWATSLLGFCTVGMLPIPWVFFRWGPGLRARSGYEHETSSGK